MTRSTAPGKIILVGEHAVVYGQPAIAVPVWDVAAHAEIIDGPLGSGCVIWARDLKQRVLLHDAPKEDALALVVRLTLQHLGVPANPDWQIDVHSTIPIASGMGSGAALSAALVQAIFAHVDQPVSPEVVSQLVFESEKLYHGTPSGIDNTVVAHALPTWFVKGQAPTTFVPKTPFTLVIADTGIASPTKDVVGDVRRAWQAAPERYTQWFNEIGALATAARTAIETGDPIALGKLFDHNQKLLAQVGVSAKLLETIIAAARQAGALGAKLSGGGRGGNMIALVDDTHMQIVQAALLAAGAKQVITTTVSA